MSAVGAAAGGSKLGEAVIHEAGDLAEKTLDVLARILETKVVLEFGVEGYKLFGRRRTRKSGDPKNPVRNRFDDRVTVKRLEVPLSAVFILAWFLGWRPGGLLGKFLERVIGEGSFIAGGSLTGTLVGGIGDQLRALLEGKGV